jgi:polyisoprenoid-binding protein YceI
MNQEMEEAMSTIERTTIAPVGTWSSDPVHSLVGFEVSYLAGTFRGQFRDASVTLTVDDERHSILEGTAEVVSVDVKDENLNAHLLSPDFFDAENFPQLAFKAEDITVDGDRITADGEITLRGVTKPVTVTGTASAPLEDPWGNLRLGLTLTATVDRTDFGLRWNNPLPSGDAALANDVTIIAELQLVKG